MCPKRTVAILQQDYPKRLQHTEKAHTEEGEKCEEEKNGRWNVIFSVVF